MSFLFLATNTGVMLKYQHSCNSHKHALDPDHEMATYTLKTGTNNLQKHLYTNHVDEWVESCDKLNIKIMAEKAKPAVDAYRARTGTRVDGQESNTACLTQKPFSPEAFVDAIVEWIVADDQVASFFSPPCIADCLLCNSPLMLWSASSSMKFSLCFGQNFVIVIYLIE